MHNNCPQYMLSLLRSIFTGRKYIFMKLNYILPLLKKRITNVGNINACIHNANVIKGN